MDCRDTPQGPLLLPRRRPRASTVSVKSCCQQGFVDGCAGGRCSHGRNCGTFASAVYPPIRNRGGQRGGNFAVRPRCNANTPTSVLPRYGLSVQGSRLFVRLRLAASGAFMPNTDKTFWRVVQPISKTCMFAITRPANTLCANRFFSKRLWRSLIRS